MAESPLGFPRIKVIALSVIDSGRANRSYGGTPGLAKASESSKFAFCSPV